MDFLLKTQQKTRAQSATLPIKWHGSSGKKCLPRQVIGAQSRFLAYQVVWQLWEPMLAMPGHWCTVEGSWLPTYAL